MQSGCHALPVQFADHSSFFFAALKLTGWMPITCMHRMDLGQVLFFNKHCLPVQKEEARAEKAYHVMLNIFVAGM